MTPTTLPEGVSMIGLHLRVIAGGDADGLGRGTASRLLTQDEPDVVDLASLVTSLSVSGDKEAARQLFQSITVIVVAGGWQAVLDDPDASRAGSRLRRPT